MSGKEAEIKLERGIKIHAGFRQIFAAAFIIFVMLVLPIYINENYDVNDVQNLFSSNKNPYSAQTLEERDGKVAGVSTSGVSTQSSGFQIPLINREVNFSEVNTNNKPLFIASIVFFSAAFFIFLYLVLGRFETA